MARCGSLDRGAVGELNIAKLPKFGRTDLGRGGTPWFPTSEVWGFSPTCARASHCRTSEVRKVQSPGMPSLGGYDRLSVGVPLDWISYCTNYQTPKVRKNQDLNPPHSGCSPTDESWSGVVAGAHSRAPEVRRLRIPDLSESGSFELPIYGRAARIQELNAGTA